MEAQISLLLSQINQAVSANMYQYDSKLLLDLLESTFKKLVDPDIIAYLKDKTLFRTKKSMNDFVKSLADNKYSRKKRFGDAVKENAKLLSSKGYTKNELEIEFKKFKR